MKTITVTISEETYEFLSTRQISIEQWVNSAIKWHRYTNEKHRQYYKRRYAKDDIFRANEARQQREWNNRQQNNKEYKEKYKEYMKNYMRKYREEK